jgi:hypothetical protein
MLNVEHLQQLIVKLLRSGLAGSQLTLYIRYCTSLATAYLFSRKNTGRLHPEYLSADVPGMQQLALDAIAELFARDEAGRFYQLIRYYEPLLDQIQADADQALFMTRRLIIAHTKQSLAKAFILNDPSGARIYRNLTLVPKRDPEIKAVTHGDDVYLYLQAKPGRLRFPDDLHPEFPEIDRETAEVVLRSSKNPSDTIPGLVHSFLRALKQETAFRHFISRQTLYYILKQFLGLNILHLNTEAGISAPDPWPAADDSHTEQTEYITGVEKFLRSEIDRRFRQ